MTQNRNPSTVRQEPPDIAGKAVVMAGVIVVFVSLVSVGAMSLILSARSDRLGCSAIPIGATAAARSSPIEQTRIRETARGQELQNRARHELDQWGWVEKGKVARIPISTAIRSLTQEARHKRLVWPDREAASDAGAGTVTP